MQRLQELQVLPISTNAEQLMGCRGGCRAQLIKEGVSSRLLLALEAGAAGGSLAR